MEAIKEIFSMPLFPHLYMIPITFVLGVMLGIQIKKTDDGSEELKPRKPDVHKNEL